ncbi:ATP-binding protein [Micrococcus sp. KBS0714]|uniref:ATP-binding protein n=1 Tax=Micrococcus sp. KBS0714 TaxID=1179670 RepID=UPI00273A41D4|nr:ATP-binding protein [Micrococcus sp. KBS0714]
MTASVSKMVVATGEGYTTIRDSTPKTLATATVDRLLHHAHVCQTTGDSVRMTQAMAGKGVMPLN